METRQDQIERETKQLRSFQRKADDLARLILNTDLAWIDIAIRIESLWYELERHFPLKRELFDMIYVSRFRRLWEQWRSVD